MAKKNSSRLAERPVKKGGKNKKEENMKKLVSEPCEPIKAPKEDRSIIPSRVIGFYWRRE